MNRCLRRYARRMVSAFVPVCFFVSFYANAAGDIAHDGTFDSNVTTEILEPSLYFSTETGHLRDIALLFNSQYVTGEFTEKDLPDLFAFVSKYPGWSYSMAMLGSAVSIPKLRERTIEFVTKLADKYPAERRLQLATGEILIKYKRISDAHPYLERAFELAMRDPDSAPEEFRLFNTAAVSKFILITADAYAHAPDSVPLREQLHAIRARVESVKAFRTESAVLDVLLLSCTQELASMKQIPALPAFVVPPANPRAQLEAELDSIARTVLDGFLRRESKSSIENPNFPTTFRMLHELGRDSELMQAALIRLAEAPDDTEAMLVIALLSFDDEDVPISAGAWDMIFERLQHPRDSMLGVYAKTLRAAKRYDDSSRFYRLYGDRTDRASLMSVEIALNFLEQGQPKDAIAILRDAFECFERSAILSDCYALLGEKEKSFDALIEARRLDPERGGTAAFRLQLASCAEAIGDMETVENELVPLIQAKTKNAEVYNALGYMFALRGYKLDDAEKYLKMALQMEPDSFAVMDSYAWLLYRKKRYEEARQYIDKAIEKMKKDPSAQDAVLLSHAGDIYFMLDRKEQARAFWQQALGICSVEVDYDGLEWRLRGGTPAQWDNYMNIKNPVRHRQGNTPQIIRPRRNP